MTKPFHIDAFHHGETIEFTIEGKRRNGANLEDPDNTTITFYVSASEGGDPVLTFTSSDAEVTQPDSGVALWLVSVPNSAYSPTLKEGVTYHYNLISEEGTDAPILQRWGTLKLKPAINWT